MIYKIWPLLLLTGCYTVLINPYNSKTEVTKKEEVIHTEQILPIVQKHYVHYPQYYNRHDRNNYPFYNNNEHYNYRTPLYIISETNPTTIQEKRPTINATRQYTEADREQRKNANPQYTEPNREQRKAVWQKRTNPRNRKPPKLTRREKDGE